MRREQTNWSQGPQTLCPETDNRTYGIFIHDKGSILNHWVNGHYLRNDVAINKFSTDLFFIPKEIPDRSMSLI